MPVDGNQERLYGQGPVFKQYIIIFYNNIVGNTATGGNI